MYCPQCRTEYREGFDTCSDCGSALVAELAPETHPDYEDLVTVLETSHEAEIAVAKSILEGADIPGFAKGRALQDVVGKGLNVLLGTIPIQVPVERAKEARQLLAEVGQDDSESPE